MNLADAVAARRSIRSFEQRKVPAGAVERALSLAVQAPAPHHSSPWRFALVEETARKESLSRTMGDAWRLDLASDGLPEERIESIVGRSHALLMATPLLVVCCADMSRAHSYPDERRRRAEWSLFAHSVGAALQVFMMGLAAEGIGSCWISAPVFCGSEVRRVLGLGDRVEPHALVLVGYPSPSYRPRPRGPVDITKYLIPPDSLHVRE